MMQPRPSAIHGKLPPAFRASIRQDSSTDEGLQRAGHRALFSAPCMLGLLLWVLMPDDGHAALPSLDGWNVSNGEITAPCPPQALACDYTTTDNGFLMRKVIMPSSSSRRPSENYWQYIMTDPGATGEPSDDPFSPTGLSFANESIIRADNISRPNASPSQSQKTIVAESIIDPVTNIEDRWSQVAYVDTPTMIVTFDQRLEEIDWSGGVGSPEVLFDSSHKVSTVIGSGHGGIKDRDQVLTQDIWQGTDLTQKFQYQVDQTPAKHYTGTAYPILPGGSNGGDLPTGNFGTKNYPLKATYIGQILSANPLSPQLFGYTAFRNHYSNEAQTTANFTDLTSLESANPAVNINRLFTENDPAIPPNTASNPLLPLYSITPNINTPAPLVTPTAWASGAPVDVAVAALNNNVANPLSGGAGTGGPPIDLGGWSVGNGVIQLDPCPATVVCGPTIAGAGFAQREVRVIADGSTFYQTIITETSATGSTAIAPQLTQAGMTAEVTRFTPIPSSIFEPPPPSDPFVPGVLAFADESFVKSGGSGGIASRAQTVIGRGNPGSPMYTNLGLIAGYIYPPAEPMAQRISLNTGWAQGTGAAPVVEIHQVLGFDDQSTSSGSSYPVAPGIFMGWEAGNQFDYTMAANGATDYTVVSIPSQHKASGLYMRKIDGGVQTTSHALTDPFLVPGGTNGGNIAWNPGDTLQALWWADYWSFFRGWTSNAFTAYTNLTTGDRTSRAQAFTRPNGAPFSRNRTDPPVTLNPPSPWVAPFDTPTPPSMPYASGYQGSTISWPGQPAW